MSVAPAEAPPRERAAVRRVLSLSASMVLLTGMLLAVSRPPWLVEPLPVAVARAGAAAQWCLCC